MKLIRLYAYLQDNLGDDLMVDILLKRYPNYKFIFGNLTGGWDYSDCRQFQNYDNFYHSKRLIKKVGRINHLFNILTRHKKEDWFLKWLDNQISKRCLCSVYIGGSLYMQKSNISISSQIKEEENKFSPHPLFIIGANFGPFFDDEYLNSFSDYFSKCGGICFRDKTSFNLFKSLNNVTYAPDVVLNYPINNSPPTDNSVIISVIDCSKRNSLSSYSSSYEKKIKEICEYCVSNNMIPILMSFCEHEGDMDAITRIYNSLSNTSKNKTQIYNYSTINDAINIFSKSSFVVATRFHSMILALRFNKPFWCFSYSNKIINVLNDIGCCNYTELSDINNVIPQELFNSTFGINNDYINNASRQFSQFDYFLENIK